MPGHPRIIGWAHTEFGTSAEPNIEALTAPRAVAVTGPAHANVDRHGEVPAGQLVIEDRTGQ